MFPYGINQLDALDQRVDHCCIDGTMCLLIFLCGSNLVRLETEKATRAWTRVSFVKMFTVV